MQSPNDRVVNILPKSAPLSNMLVNSSVVDDKYNHVYRISNSTDLTNNYAPIGKMMTDSTYSRNINPLARYLDTSVPYFHDMLYNDRIINQIASHQNINCEKIMPDVVRLNSQPLQINRNVVTPSGEYPEIRQIDIMKENDKHINQTMFVNSGVIDVIDDAHQQTSELKNNYPDNTVAIEAYNPLIGSSREPENIISGKIDKIKERSSGYFNNISNSVDTLNVVNEHIFSQRGSGSHRPKFVIAKEGYTREKNDTYIDQVYIRALEARARAVADYVRSNYIYKPWAKAWTKMYKSLARSNFTFSRLQETDADIAYTINKGESTKFRIRGKNYSYIPLNISQYVLYHEMAHAANDKFGHGKEFCDKLAILCLAASELGFVNLKNIKKELYLTNEQPILCQADMKGEIKRGIDLIVEANPSMRSHYKEYAEFIDRQ